MENLKTSPSSRWKQELRRLLNRPPQPESPPVRLVIVGIGNELKGDDGVGPVTARRLKQFLSEDPVKPLILEACNAPENMLGPIIRSKPEVVLLIDAADTGGVPGSIQWFPGQTAGGMGGSTHTLSMAMLSDYLFRETGAKIYVLTIQPQSFTFGESLSPRVQSASRLVAKTIATYWRSAATAVSANTSDGVSVDKA